jgi:hypothetical protein
VNDFDTRLRRSERKERELQRRINELLGEAWPRLRARRVQAPVDLAQPQSPAVVTV